MTHPGVGPVMSWTYVLTGGPVERFPNRRQLASYLGLNPREHSRGGDSVWGRSASKATA